MKIIEIIKKIYNNKKLKVSFDLLLVMVSVLVVSYAWFFNGTKTESKDLNIKTKASRLLYISLDYGENWNTELSLNLNDNFKFNNEVTSNGIDFYKAYTKRDDGTPVTFTTAESGMDYLEFIILFKANAPLGIFLDSDSEVIPAGGTSDTDLIGINSVRKSSYGDFSRDLIAGAVRIAFIETDYINEQYIPKLETSLVWAPNKNYELIYNNRYYNFDINSTNEQDYRYIDASDGVNYENVDNLRDELHTDYVNDYSNGDLMLTKIDPDYHDGVKAITVRIWIEGNDREAHTALTGGMFKLNLNFMGLLKEDNELIPNVTANTEDNTIDNYQDTMEYSNNLGINWIKYSEEQNPIFEEGNTVWVRYSENANYYASNYVELNY